jgi:hypothetical protein
MTPAESDRNLEALIAELRAQVAAHRNRGAVHLVAQLDADGNVTRESRVKAEGDWRFPCR